MNVKKHRFPVMLLVFTLILALLVSGLGWPGYLLPLLAPKTDKTETDDDGEVQKVLLPEGKSKAFTINPVEGVTISAEENVLDKDREFTMEEVTVEEYNTLSEAGLELEEDMMVLSAWELDAGLADNEMLPGTFKMEFDLNKLDIDEEIYDNLRIYRVADNGKWSEYACDIQGSKLIANSRQNSIIVITAAGVLAAIEYGAAIAAIAATPDTMQGLKTGAYFFTPVRWDVKGFDIKVDGDWRFRLLIKTAKFRELVYSNSPEGKKAIGEAEDYAFRTGMKECVNASDLPDTIKKDFTDRVNKMTSISTLKKEQLFESVMNLHPENKNTILILKKKFLAREKQLYKDNLEAREDYRKFQEQLKIIKYDEPNLLELQMYMQSLARLEIALNNAWMFLKQQGGGLIMPTDKIDVHVADEENNEAAGVAVPAMLENPYLVIYLFDHTSTGEDKEYDTLQLTVVHELFHIIQRKYVFYLRANYGFDEMSAQMVEADTYDYMLDNGIITTSMSLENMSKYRYFAIPLDNYSTTYPEGTIGNGKDDGRAETSYARAPFLRYLMGGNLNDANYTYHEVMSGYAATSGHSYMTTILKACFSMDDKRMTRKYHLYAIADQDTFYEYSKNCDDKVFAPIADLKNGKTDIKLVNKKYTIRVRKIKVPHNNLADKEYSVVLKYNDDYRDIMSDFEITPIGGLEEDRDYRNWDKGIFVEPRKYPWDVSKPLVYLLEVDGGLSSSEGYIYDDYSGYSLYVLTPPEPQIEKKDGMLTIQPMKLDDYKKDVIDSVVVTGMLGDKQVMRERIEYKGWDQPKTLDLNKLMKLDGESLSKEDKEKVKFKVQECVIGTYEYDKPCLGPAYDDDSEGLNITGTWELDCESDYSSDMLDPIMQQYQDIIGQYGDMYGLDSIEGLYDLTDQYQQSQKGYKNKATMIVKRADKENEYDVVFKYDNDPNSVSEYHGSFDEAKMQLSLKQKDTKYTDSDGKTYNLSEFGLLGEMNFTVTVNKGADGKNELTIEGEGTVTSSIANVSSKMNGKKISDKTE